MKVDIPNMQTRGACRLFRPKRGDVFYSTTHYSSAQLRYATLPDNLDTGRARTTHPLTQSQGRGAHGLHTHGPPAVGQGQRMGLGVEDPVVETEQGGVTEQEVKVLQGLGEPKALHVVHLRGDGLDDVLAAVVARGVHFGHDGVQRGVAVGGACVLDDGLEHVPADVAPVGVAGDAVHDEDAFDGFRSQQVFRVHDLEPARGEVAGGLAVVVEAV